MDRVNYTLRQTIISDNKVEFEMVCEQVGKSKETTKTLYTMLENGKVTQKTSKYFGL
jgi:hypothetical protein